MKDAEIEVVSRLLEIARLIRRRGPADQAEKVLKYERLLEKDLKTREAELAQLPGFETKKEPAHV